jgi:hypothetical protein
VTLRDWGEVELNVARSVIEAEPEGERLPVVPPPLRAGGLAWRLAQMRQSVACLTGRRKQ